VSARKCREVAVLGAAAIRCGRQTAERVPRHVHVRKAQQQGAPSSLVIMAKKAMKAMKSMKAMKGVKSMSKGAIADALGAAVEKKRSEMSKVLEALAEIASKEVKGTGKFVIPGVCMIKTRHKPATKAGKRMAFGKEMRVKAKPARTIVKAFAVAALKKSV